MQYLILITIGKVEKGTNSRKICIYDLCTYQFFSVTTFGVMKNVSDPIRRLSSAIVIAIVILLPLLVMSLLDYAGIVI